MFTWADDDKRCLIGLFGPELVVFTAWRQWDSAKALGVKVNAAIATRHEDQNPQWSHVHGFFAGMGGFAINTGALPSNEAFPLEKRFSLTPRGVHLAKCGHLPQVPKE